MNPFSRMERVLFFLILVLAAPGLAAAQDQANPQPAPGDPAKAEKANQKREQDHQQQYQKLNGREAEIMRALSQPKSKDEITKLNQELRGLAKERGKIQMQLFQNQIDKDKVQQQLDQSRPGKQNPLGPRPTGDKPPSDQQPPGRPIPSAKPTPGDRLNQLKKIADEEQKTLQRSGSDQELKHRGARDFDGARALENRLRLEAIKALRDQLAENQRLIAIHNAKQGSIDRAGAPAYDREAKLLNDQRDQIIAQLRQYGVGR